ncbi:MAG: cellulase family glycosylhydrolase, partial [Bacteroidota bacterium]
DDFYTDAIIRAWFKSYLSSLAQRVNTYTGVSYREDPYLFGWELANEPRSSDRSGLMVTGWINEMAAYLKQVDTNHLVGTGEEGFDTGAGRYTFSFYNNQSWLFDGSAGVSFAMNSANSHIDFASIHLYPQSWNLSNAAGNIWISDHISVAAAFGKPLVVGEFGTLSQPTSTYDSWLTTALFDGAAGAVIWQLLEGQRPNDGFGIRCPHDGSVCAVLQSQATRFNAKSVGGSLPPPPAFSLFQNYPNPCLSGRQAFNGQTTIAYDVPGAAHVSVELFNSLGEKVATVVDAFQHAGTRKELLDVGSLPSGAYFYRVSIQPTNGQTASATKKLVIVK